MMLLTLALLLAPAPDRALERPIYAARTQLGYEVYTWFREDRRPLADLVEAGTLVVLPVGTSYRVIPLVGDETQERPICAHLKLLSGEHRDQTVYVVASDLEARP